MFWEILKSAILGIIQGITEWLPISSTGHLILAEEFIKLKVSPEFSRMFEVVIQLGSILAVLVLYFHKLNPFSSTKNRRERESTFILWFKVIVAAIPAGLVGVLFDDKVEEIFFNPQTAALTVGITLILYGILFIILENRHKKPKIKNLNNLDYRTAFLIGIFQILAIIPGTSRSGSTILGAVFLGTSRSIAAEFSFFLAIPMMFGASGLKILKFAQTVMAGEAVFGSIEIAVLLTGMIVAFVVSIFAIRFLMGYIKRHNFKVFGYYRIILGIIVLLYFILIKK